MKKGMVSVIIPVYGVEMYIDQCIDSVVNQSYEDLEIILVDDGSKDRCPAICDEWSQKDKRIKVIHQENKGLSGARNAALNVFTGEYVTFLDGDDLFHTNMISEMLCMMDDKEADIVGCDFTKFYAEDDLHLMQKQKENVETDLEVTEYSRERILQILVDAGGDWLVTACIKLYRAYIFEKLRFPEGKLHEDEFMIHRTLALADKYVYIKKPLYFYRQHEKSIMAKKNKWADKDEMEAYEERVDFLHKEFANIKLDTLIFKIIFLYICLENTVKWKTLYKKYKAQLGYGTKLKIALCRMNPKIYESIKAVCRR